MQRAANLSQPLIGPFSYFCSNFLLVFARWNNVATSLANGSLSGWNILRSRLYPGSCREKLKSIFSQQTFVPGAAYLAEDRTHRHAERGDVRVSDQPTDVEIKQKMQNHLSSNSVPKMFHKTGSSNDIFNGKAGQLLVVLSVLTLYLKYFSEAWMEFKPTSQQVLKLWILHSYKYILSNFYSQLMK